MKKEDEEFRKYLAENGYDVSQMGLLADDHPAHYEEGASRTHSATDSFENKEKKAEHDEAVVTSGPVN